MFAMFGSCYELEEIDVSKFVTSNVKNMSGMFEDLIVVEVINVTKFDTHQVEDMSNMFKYCNNAKSKYQAYYCCACSLFVLKDYKLAERELELCRQLTNKGIEDPEDIESMIVTCKAKQNPSLYGQKEDFI